MKKMILKYRVLAGGALFTLALTYLTGCCCPCYYPTSSLSAPTGPSALPKLKDMKAPTLEANAQGVRY